MTYNFSTNIEHRMPTTGKVYFVDRMTSDYAQQHPFDVDAFIEDVYTRWQQQDDMPEARETREALRRQWERTLAVTSPRGNASLYPNKNGQRRPALMEVWMKAAEYWRRGLRPGDTLPAIAPACKITRREDGSWIALFPKDAHLLSENEECRVKSEEFATAIPASTEAAEQTEATEQTEGTEPQAPAAEETPAPCSVGCDTIAASEAGKAQPTPDPQLYTQTEVEALIAAALEQANREARDRAEREAQERAAREAEVHRREQRQREAEEALHRHQQEQEAARIAAEEAAARARSEEANRLYRERKAREQAEQEARRHRQEQSRRDREAARALRLQQQAEREAQEARRRRRRTIWHTAATAAAVCVAIVVICYTGLLIPLGLIGLATSGIIK